MSNNSMISKALIVIIMITGITSISSSPPVWVASSFFKAGKTSIYSGAVTFAFTGGSSNQTGSITYSSAIVQTTLKVPTLGITHLDYQINSGAFLIHIVVTACSVTGMTFRVAVNSGTNLRTLKMTYMALDNSFTPAFSMNYFFPVTIKLFRTLISITHREYL